MIDKLGFAFTVKVLTAEPVHPFASVTVTVYAPADDTVIVAVVEALFQVYEMPPLAVNCVEDPAQIVLVPAIVATGLALTTNAKLLEAVQLLASVTVTVYSPAFDTVIEAVVAALLHKYEVPPNAENTVEVPSQILSIPKIDAVGLAFTVKVRDAEAVQPFASVTVTV